MKIVPGLKQKGIFKYYFLNILNLLLSCQGQNNQITWILENHCHLILNSAYSFYIKSVQQFWRFPKAKPSPE